MGKTNIEWASDVWNPLVGCSRVSEGCRHCYAERQAYRAAAMGISRYDGITKKVGSEIRWTGKVALVESALELPLKWKKPRRIFVNSMSDLFHEAVPDEWIDRIFSVMAQAPQHTFQILTKRPERMLKWSNRTGTMFSPAWPLRNVWLGVSVEDQAARFRLDVLRQTPAAVRFASLEPVLEDLGNDLDLTGIDQAIFGGESGPNARPCDLAWIRRGMARARAADCAVFVKQLGARPMADCRERDEPCEAGPCFDTMNLRDRKGGDPAEWPEDLRVREYPK